MTTKRKDETPVTNSNINTNTNNINVNVRVEPQKTPRKINSSKKVKSNWMIKAIVLGIIGLVLTLLGDYIKKHFYEHNGNPAVIENTAPISGTKVK